MLTLFVFSVRDVGSLMLPIPFRWLVVGWLVGYCFVELPRAGWVDFRFGSVDPKAGLLGPDLVALRIGLITGSSH